MELSAFELADELLILIYGATRQFPKEEIFGLVSRMRRAVVFVPSNIVGGCARESQTEYLRFLENAFGSLRERHYQICGNRKGFRRPTPINAQEKSAHNLNPNSLQPIAYSLTA